MPWARFDDAYPNSRKVRPLTDAAFRLDVSAICWANANLTDGIIADDELATVSDVRQPKKAAGELVSRGRWERDDDAGRWRIHDFHDYNPTAGKVREDRAAAAERQRKAREARKSQATSQRESQEESHGESRSDNGRSHTVSHRPPDPTRPDPPTDLASLGLPEEPPNPPPAGGRSCAKHARRKAYCEACDRANTSPRPDWCGHCDPDTRLLETEQGIARCPDCHELTTSGAKP